jgi:hypothetical protein
MEYRRYSGEVEGCKREVTYLSDDILHLLLDLLLCPLKPGVQVISNAASLQQRAERLLR